MKTLALVTAATLLSATASLAQSSGEPHLPVPSDIGLVAPALESYAQDTLVDKLWRRPGLSARDRSVVTVAALIAHNQTADLPAYIKLALDSGVTPSELSGIITHLAFYAGWENAMAAVAAVRPVFVERNIRADQLAPARMQLLPADEKADAERARSVDKTIGSAAPGLVQDTTDVLFRDLWLRPDLTPLDRSLVTVSALVATGQFGQLAGHLARALNNGLTRAEASEAISHLAYYGGWPNAFSAATICAHRVRAARRTKMTMNRREPMPHVIVKLASGRSEQQKAQIAAEVTKAIMATADVGEDAVSVSIEDYAQSEWAEKVYRPDIMGKAGTLYKKPGYTID
jgi:4-carboxymuconolactone decarboxylase